MSSILHQTRSSAAHLATAQRHQRAVDDARASLRKLRLMVADGYLGLTPRMARPLREEIQARLDRARALRDRAMARHRAAYARLHAFG